jgi:hypothetical protein
MDTNQIPAGAARLVLGLLPGTLDMKDLRVVDPADPPVQDGRREAFTPPFGRLGPLSGPPHVDELVAHIHQLAVDRPGPRRVELIRERREHRLIQQPHAVAHATLLDQRPAFPEHADGNQVRVAEPTSDVLHPLGRSDGTVELATCERGEGLEVERIAVLGSLGFLGQQPMHPAHPSGTGRGIPALHGVCRHKHGRHRGSSWLPGLQVQPVGLCPGRQRLADRTKPPRRLSQGVAIIGCETTCLTSSVETVPRSGPLATPKRLVGRLQQLGPASHGHLQRSAVRIVAPDAPAS